MEAILPQAFRRSLRRVASLFAIVLITLQLTCAHDIPNDITAHLILKAEVQRLNLVARVPLKAVRDVIFPERAGGYLDIEKNMPLLSNLATMWISDFMELREGDNRLPFRPRAVASRISLESDKSFASYEQATAHLTGPSLPNDTNVVWNQAMLDAWFEYPIQSDQSAFSIRPDLGGRGIAWSRCFDFYRPAGRCVPSNSSATRAWCGSIRDGTRPRCGSST